MKSKVSINAGACGYVTKVEADFDKETGLCALKIDCTCPHFNKAAEKLHAVRPSEEYNWEKSVVHATMRDNCSHTACPVPSGIIKAVQVASGMKKGVNASITFEPTE